LTKRLLIVSTLDSNEPFGAFTRPFYLGMYLSKHFKVLQLGLDCSAVDYTESISLKTRSLFGYIKAIQKCIAEFNPDLIYAQETLPGLAALIVFTLKKPKKCRLVFDFHTLSAFEYGTRLTSASNRFNQFTQLIKTYIAQGVLINANKPIIAASQSIIDLIPQWYKISPQSIYCVSNGVANDLLNVSTLVQADPYKQIRPTKIVVVIAPKTFSFPTNDMSVSLTLKVAKYLESCQQDIHLVVIGRDREGFDTTISSNITFTGYLPKRSDFLAHLLHADIGLLPFSKEAVAGGARNKALDCLACRKLVVSTPEGLRGLEEFVDRQHLLISGYSAEEIANTIIDACLNLENYQPLIEESYNLIQEKYSWNAMADKVADILNNVCR
jgi:glycosyltransferase involved in cell wall biosynthesis